MDLPKRDSARGLTFCIIKVQLPRRTDPRCALALGSVTHCLTSPCSQQATQLKNQSELIEQLQAHVNRLEHSEKNLRAQLQSGIKYAQCLNRLVVLHLLVAELLSPASDI